MKGKYLCCLHGPWAMSWIDTEFPIVFSFISSSEDREESREGRSVDDWLFIRLNLEVAWILDVLFIVYPSRRLQIYGRTRKREMGLFIIYFQSNFLGFIYDGPSRFTRSERKRGEFGIIWESEWKSRRARLVFINTIKRDLGFGRFTKRSGKKLNVNRLMDGLGHV